MIKFGNDNGDAAGDRRADFANMVEPLDDLFDRLGNRLFDLAGIAPGTTAVTMISGNGKCGSTERGIVMNA